MVRDLAAEGTPEQVELKEKLWKRISKPALNENNFIHSGIETVIVNHDGLEYRVIVAKFDPNDKNTIYKSMVPQLKNKEHAPKVTFPLNEASEWLHIKHYTINAMKPYTDNLRFSDSFRSNLLLEGYNLNHINAIIDNGFEYLKDDENYSGGPESKLVMEVVFDTNIVVFRPSGRPDFETLAEHHLTHEDTAFLFYYGYYRGIHYYGTVLKVIL